MGFKVKSLDDKVKEYRMGFGIHKDKLLEDTPVEYIDWALKSYDRLTDWDKKVMNRFLHVRAVAINEQMEEDLEEHNLEMGAWVDENF